MIHLKTFSQIFEDAEYWSPDPSVRYPIDQIRGLQSYKDLTSKYGWVDITTDRVAKSGNITFEHAMLPGNKYQVYNNGYIRINSGPVMYNSDGRWSPLVSPIQDRDKDFAQPIKSLNDYDLKFEWLTKYLLKKMIISLGINRIRSLSSKSTIEDIKRVLDRMIEKDPSFAKKQEIQFLKKQGFYDPSDFSGDMIKAASYNLI